MNIKEIREKNMLVLAAEAGSIKELAKRAGTAENYLYQVRSNTNKRRMGDRVARKLEQAMGKHYGWIDTNHETDSIRVQDNHSFRVNIDLDNLKKAIIDFELMTVGSTLNPEQKAQIIVNLYKKNIEG